MRKSRITDEERDLLNTPPPRRAPFLLDKTPAPAKKRRKPQPIGPGYNGVFEIGAREVENPYQPGEMITVPANVRHDPLARMLNRKEIDRAQFQAGEWFRGLLEQAGERGAAAVDFTREPVDGKTPAVDISEGRMQAARALAEAQAVLGWQTYRLVRGVVSDGLNGALIAQAVGDRVDREFVKKCVREGLEQLATFWGLIADEKHVSKHAAMRSMISDMPQWTDKDVDAVVFLRKEVE